MTTNDCPNSHCSVCMGVCKWRVAKAAHEAAVRDFQAGPKTDRAKALICRQRYAELKALET
jgi:NAD-dependent dihydropyrimidine dehydrogenase PreA subunit